MTEEELINACIEGNQRACKELYEQNKGWLYAICLRYHKNGIDAQDSLQESFITIYRNLHSFKAQGSFKGWMRKVTVRCILSRFRKKNKLAENNFESQTEPIDISLLNTLDKEELTFLIERLPTGRKQIFVAHAIDGFSHKEIAEMLSISEGTSKSQFFHARRELREALEKEIVIAKNMEHE
ncbi:MAG: RNA polymerase sigma factor [Bacteroidetes bacterium]|nr:RNA polymerase sigma factor [Bacteroidota bacterium]